MNGIDIEKYLKDLRIPYILKNIIKLLIPLLLILWASTLITKLLLSSTIEPRLIEINNVLIKKEKMIELYKQNLNECYSRHGEKGCIRIEKKLLDLKADYNNYLIDCNQELKELDTDLYRGNCEDMTKLYTKETNEQNKTKEFSVLESMVDADAISKAKADSFSDSYTTLLDDLKTNINTLRREGLNIKTAVTASPEPIVGEEEVIYGKWVKPSRSICEGSGGIYDKYDDNDCRATWENAKSICRENGDVLPDIETLGAVIIDCGGDYMSYYNDNVNNRIERIDSNIANEAYQICYKEKGFTSDYTIYWSSATYVSNLSLAWGVYFYDGIDDWGDKAYEGRIRCVRGRQ